LVFVKKGGKVGGENLEKKILFMFKEENKEKWEKT